MAPNRSRDPAPPDLQGFVKHDGYGRSLVDSRVPIVRGYRNGGPGHRTCTCADQRASSVPTDDAADQRTSSSPQPDLGGSLTAAVTSLTLHLALYDRHSDRTRLATHFERFEAQLEHRRLIRTLAFLGDSHDSVGPGAHGDQDIALKRHYVTDQRCVEPVTRSIRVSGERLVQPEGHAGSGGNDHGIQRGRNSLLGAGGAFAPHHTVVVAGQSLGLRHSPIARFVAGLGRATARHQRCDHQSSNQA